MPLTVKQLETSVNASGVVRAPNPPPPTGDARVSPPRLSDLAFGVFKPPTEPRSHRFLFFVDGKSVARLREERAPDASRV